MFVRGKKSRSKNHRHEYLDIVESYRDGSSVRQRVIATLGRLDQLKALGQIDGLIPCLARFSGTLKGICANREPRITLEGQGLGASFDGQPTLETTTVTSDGAHIMHRE